MKIRRPCAHCGTPRPWEPDADGVARPDAVTAPEGYTCNKAPGGLCEPSALSAMTRENVALGRARRAGAHGKRAGR